MSLGQVYVIVRDPGDADYFSHDGICAGVFLNYDLVVEELLRQGYKHLHLSVWMPYEHQELDWQRRFDEVVADKSDKGADARWGFWGNAPEYAVHVFCLPVNVFVDHLVLRKFGYDAEGAPSCSA